MPLSALRLRQPLNPLSRLTLAGLLISALAFGLLLLLIGQVIVAIAIVIACLLIASALIIAGWRWSPLLGAFMGVGTIIGGQSYTLYHLAHPNEFGFFSAIVLILACSLVEIVAGISAVLKRYRGKRRIPSWLPNALSGLIGLVVGTLLVSGLVSLMAQATTIPTTTTNTGSEATVHMGPGNFVTSSVTVAKGSKLRLVDDGTFTHILKNGAWNANGQALPAQESGAPVLNNLTVNSGFIEVGPFNTAGTYHIYCTIHQNMNLTVVVQ